MEINGFKISKYNIHNFPEGVKYHTCPLCSESRKKKTQKCVVLHWNSGLAKCSHCGEVIQLHEFEKKNKSEKYIIPEWENNTKLSDNVVKWFEKRKISQFILRLMKIGEGVHFMPPNKNEKQGKEKNTIQFPYFRNGQIVDIKYRAGDKTFNLYKGAERMSYNLDNIQGQEIIYCVEGEPDVLAVMECGIHNVTSPPNGFPLLGSTVNLDWLNNDVEHFMKAEKLILAFDNDGPGENGKKEFIRRFGAHKCFTVDLKECKDSNDYLIKYGPEELKKALEAHIEIPLENVSTYNDYKEQVRDFFLNGMPKGLTTKNLYALDDNFSTNFGQTLMVTGQPSSGKSEVVDQMVLGYALQGYPVAFASIENKPNQLHYQKLIRKLTGIAPTEKSHFNKSFEACEDFVQEYITMIDLENGYDLERVLIKAEELVFRKGIRVLVIDPYNKVPYKGSVESITGNRTNDYTAKYHQLIHQFKLRLDVFVILVAHPIKLPKMENGKRVIPDFYDVKGGGEHYDMCEHGIVVSRDYQLDLTLIRTLKVKFAHLGENNKDSWFKYNINNGRLCDIDGDPENVDGFNILWDNDNWVTKRENTEQKEIFNNNDIEPDYEEWRNQENREVPF